MTLESIEVWSDFTPDEGYDALVANNKVLRDMGIHVFFMTDMIEADENEDDDIAMFMAFDITNSFMESPALQFLRINDEDDESPLDYFEPVCEELRTTYRHRRVHVRIFGKSIS